MVLVLHKLFSIGCDGATSVDRLFRDMKRVVITKSGNKVLINDTANNRINVDIVGRNGKPDLIVKEFEVGKVSNKEFEKMMEKPKEFNVERFGIREVGKRPQKLR